MVQKKFRVSRKKRGQVRLSQQLFGGGGGRGLRVFSSNRSLTILTLETRNSMRNFWLIIPRDLSFRISPAKSKLDMSTLILNTDWTSSHEIHSFMRNGVGGSLSFTRVPRCFQWLKTTTLQGLPWLLEGPFAPLSPTHATTSSIEYFKIFFFTQIYFSLLFLCVKYCVSYFSGLLLIQTLPSHSPLPRISKDGRQNSIMPAASARTSLNCVCMSMKCCFPYSCKTWVEYRILSEYCNTQCLLWSWRIHSLYLFESISHWSRTEDFNASWKMVPRNCALCNAFSQGH